MAGRIADRAPQALPWPWPRTPRESLIEPNPLDRRRRLKKAADPNNPPLASVALLEFMGLGRSSEDLRLPPVGPDPQDGGDSAGDAQALESLVEFAGESRPGLEKAMQRVSIPADRAARMQALLAREAGMLAVISRLSEELRRIGDRIRDERRSQES